MTDHPSQFALEAYAVGEANPEVENHLRTCRQCRDYVQELLLERSVMMNEIPASTFLNTPSIQAAFATHESPRRRSRWFELRFWLPTLATACAVIIWMNIGRVHVEPEPAPIIGLQDGQDIPNGPLGRMQNDIRLKGGPIRVEVSRLRDGTVQRFFNDFSVRKGDRLSIALHLGQANTLDVVLHDEITGQWIQLATDQAFSVGRTDITSDTSQEVTDQRTRAQILVGSSEDLKRVRAGDHVDAVKRIQITPESAP